MALSGSLPQINLGVQDHRWDLHLCNDPRPTSAQGPGPQEVLRRPCVCPLPITISKRDQILTQNLVSLKTCRVEGLMYVKSVKTRSPPIEVTWKFGEGVPTQVSSSFDRGS
ncbi:hypothetical protein TNCV_3819301 [Trichonephila clavipes]|nr:hypothetical protein TNCV_3819301 [Trichonephila clavipes]